MSLILSFVLDSSKSAVKKLQMGFPAHTMCITVYVYRTRNSNKKRVEVLKDWILYGTLCSEVKPIN